MALLSELSHYGPSICVKFVREKVLAGYGPFVHVYDSKNGQLLNVVRIFHINKVHGISVKNETIVIYGGKSVCVVKLLALMEKKDVSSDEKRCHEWIIDAVFHADDKRILILTSYNQVITCGYDGSIESVTGILGEKAILYSGSIRVLSKNEIYVNAGTVLEGIIIWDLIKEKTLLKLTGHEGSIFSVKTSDNGKLIASCSDDRSIKLWNFEDGRLLSTAWGHTARIWDLQFICDNKRIASVSEDSTCRIWRILETSELVLEETYNVHLIKSSWGVDVNEEKLVAATCGNDGKVVLTNLNQDGTMRQSLGSGLSSELAVRDMELGETEIIKGAFWLEFGIVVVTSMGRILKYSNSNSEWSAITEEPRFISFSVMTGIQSQGLILIWSSSGELLLMRFSQNGELIQRKNLSIRSMSKIMNCLLVLSGSDLMIAIESPNSRDPFMCVKLDPKTLDKTMQLSWPKPLKFVSTCLAVLDEKLVVGSRFSSVAVFDMACPNNEPVVWRNLTPGDAISSISFVECTSDEKSLFSVTNRDGFYAFVLLDFKKKSFSVLHNNRVSKGFLEGAFYNESGDYITYGFRSSLFYVFNETKQQEIATEVCGGAHRLWKFFPNLENDVSIFLYVRAKKLHVKKFSGLRTIVLNTGIHGREIRDLTLINKLNFKGLYLLCTGSEDTTVKLNLLDSKTGSIKTVWTQRKHTSGLQRCKFFGSNFMISSGAREELFLWEVNTSMNSNPYIRMLASLPTSSDSPDLRIMDFDFLGFEHFNDFLLATAYSDSAIKVWRYKQKCSKFELLVSGHYKDCCLLNIKFTMFDGKLHLIVSATDGMLILWDLNIVYSSLYERLISGSGAESLPTQSLPEFVSRISVHKAGVRAIDVKALSSKQVRIFSGGDDNALAMTDFKIIEGNHYACEVICRNQSASASTITSVGLFQNGQTLATTSVDQKVQFYNVSENELNIVGKRATTVADTGCLAALELEERAMILIGGMGLSVWNYEY
ncbi:LAMI_0D09890g1_1 [Lachancea mirantina]|uniref:LAMI_0D09890g1_1 n=1 Tax=Lachancea mirantina TaxID=1230905 RepID=A0A1G4JDV8_9SACH|nr:LAMI_0D09890g1_1 [Lachancea mirantina]